MTIKLSDSSINNAAKRFSAGETIRSIANDIGIGECVLARRLRKRGIVTSRSHNRVDLPEKEVISMYESGESENSVSKNFGVSRAVIRRHLEEAGVHIRTQGEAEALKWSQMSDEQRENQVKAAHAAATGRKRTPEELAKGARSRHESPDNHHIGFGEPEFGAFLHSRGIPFEYQAPVKGYNVDFMIGRVAVEITANRCRYASPDAKQIKRIKDLLNCDIRTLAVSFDKVESLMHFADYVVSECERLGRKRSFGCEYWVIRCRSEDYAIVKNERMQFTSVPAPVKFLKSWKAIDLR